jgi:hypothetical protein
MCGLFSLFIINHSLVFIIFIIIPSLSLFSIFIIIFIILLHYFSLLKFCVINFHYF